MMNGAAHSAEGRRFVAMQFATAVSAKRSGFALAGRQQFRVRFTHRVYLDLITALGDPPKLRALFFCQKK